MMRIRILSAILFLAFALQPAAAGTVPADVGTLFFDIQDPGLPVYNEARELLWRRHYAEAAEKYESFLAAFPRSIRADDATYYLGFCRERLGQKQEAFNYYVRVVERYKGSPPYARALERAIDLAQELRRKKGDRYDKFLTRRVISGRSEIFRLRSGIRLAELGDWSALPLLIDGLEQGDEALKVRIAKLLGRRIGDKKVQKAFEEALLESKNEIVRMMAAANLARKVDVKSVRDTLRRALLSDHNRIVRMTAASSLRGYMDDKDVEEAFVSIVSSERDPYVLVTIIDTIGPHQIDREIKLSIVKRIETESDPIVRYALMSGLRFSTNIEIDEDFFIRSLVENPSPTIRLNALNLLAPKANDPKVQAVIVRTLENDPNISVKIAAASLLANHVTDENVRKAMLQVTVEHSDDDLVSTTVRVLSNQVVLPEVRGKFIEMLDAPHPMYVTASLVSGLSSQADLPEVQDAFLRLLERSKDRNLKIFTLHRLPKVVGSERVRRLVKIYKAEEDPVLARDYLKLIAAADPKMAETLVSERER